MNVKKFSVQVKMARAALGWTVQDLAGRASLSLESVTKAEKADESLRLANWKALQHALEHAGIEFREDGSVLLHDDADLAEAGITVSSEMPTGVRFIWPSQHP